MASWEKERKQAIRRKEVSGKGRTMDVDRLNGRDGEADDAGLNC